jgi:hypothetical protein
VSWNTGILSFWAIRPWLPYPMLTALWSDNSNVQLCRHQIYRHIYRLFGGMLPDITGHLKKGYKQKSPDLQGFRDIMRCYWNVYLVGTAGFEPATT